MGKKERVILIKGDKSKWYEQAIFIVNQNTPQENIPVDFVFEAEKIIQNHVRKSYGMHVGNTVGIAYSNLKTSQPAVIPKNKKKPKISRFDFTINTIMAIGCFVIAAAIIWGILG